MLKGSIFVQIHHSCHPIPQCQVSFDLYTTAQLESHQGCSVWRGRIPLEALKPSQDLQCEVEAPWMVSGGRFGVSEPVWHRWSRHSPRHIIQKAQDGRSEGEVAQVQWRCTGCTVLCLIHCVGACTEFIPIRSCPAATGSITGTGCKMCKTLQRFVNYGSLLSLSVFTLHGESDN